MGVVGAETMVGRRGRTESVQDRRHATCGLVWWVWIWFWKQFDGWAVLGFGEAWLESLLQPRMHCDISRKKEGDDGGYGGQASML